MSWRKTICIVSVVAYLFIAPSALFAAEEADITNQLVTEGNNKALLMFTIPASGLDTEFDKWFETRNYVLCHTVTESPLGITEYVTGEDNQIEGNSGFRFYIPTSLADKPNGKHALVGFASTYLLKRDVIGAERFDALVAEAQQLYDNGEGVGSWTTPYDPFFLNRYDLQVFMRFQDGKVRNVTAGGVLMLTMDLSNAANGDVLFGFGALAIDKDATDISWHESERKTFPGESLTLSFIYDGVADGNIDVTWWIAAKPQGNDYGNGNSSGGCSTGAVVPSIAAIALAVFVCIKKRKLF
jgi:hypothetical protein